MKYLFSFFLVVLFIFSFSFVVHAAPPAGFQTTTYAKVPFLPTDIEFAPDSPRSPQGEAGGRLFALDKLGAVWVIKNGVRNAEPFLSLKVSGNSERGLLGLAFDPDFKTNRFIYLYYTTATGSIKYAGTPKNRVSRFQASSANPDVADKISEKILLDNIASDAGNHNGGELKIGKDKKLYISVGDGGSIHTNSQNLSNLSGKILRINLDGSVPTDNPFYGQKGKRGEIWAYGFRNPWKFTLHPTLGFALVGDVGEGSFEEIDVVKPGLNYGWPQTEGPKPANVSGVTYPAYSYAHTNMGGAIIGGEVYTGTQFPKEYQGSYFFSDFTQYFIRRVQFDQSGRVTLVQNFDTDVGGTIGFTSGTDGSLYYIHAESMTQARIQKITYVGGGKAKPTLQAAAAVSPLLGSLPLTVSFAADELKNKSLGPVTYQWDFGDGKFSNKAKVTHVYTRRKIYTATLTVSDAHGNKALRSVSIDAGNHAPVAAISVPKALSSYKAGDKIAYRGSAVDREDGRINPKNFSWEIEFHHNTHTHPFLGPIAGKSSGVFTVPDSGEPATNTWFIIRLTVKDAQGVTAKAERKIIPQVVSATLSSNIPGIQLTLDGKPVSVPYAFKSVVNFQHIIVAPLTAVVNGRTYVFQKWSDNKSRGRVIRPGKNKTRYTAEYVLQQ